MTESIELERVVIEVLGGCNYSCQMCPQSTGRDSGFTRKMPLSLFADILDDVVQYGKPVINLEGSGEPTMARDLPDYIKECRTRDLPSFMFTNGSLMHGDFMRHVIDSGINFIRFSIIGYNPEMYHKWMSEDNFDLLVDNIRQTQDYIRESGSTCEVSSYHLITDTDNIQYELAQYQALVKRIGTTAYIWRMHNWSGNHDEQGRVGEIKTCGRPFAPELTVRAGGINGHRGAVTPCCQTMGPPNEATSVLGHLDEQTIKEVWTGELYQQLRHAHATGRIDDIPYCKGCDFLISDPDVLVWTNDPEMKSGHILGTNIDLNQKRW